MKKIIVNFLAILALTSCYTTKFIPNDNEAISKVYEGKEYSELINAMGVPDKIIPDGNGGQILSYENVSYKTDGTIMRGYGFDTVSSTSQEIKSSTAFYLDENNRCYKVQTDGGQYVRVKSKGRTLGLTLGLAIGIPVITAISIAVAASN